MSSVRDDGPITASPWKAVRTLRAPTAVKPAPLFAMSVRLVAAVAPQVSLRRVSVSVAEWPPSSQAAVPAAVAQ